MEKKASILIVDDNSSQRQTMASVLRYKGFEVLTANNGIEAIQIVTERFFDIIFMDIKMPLMDGVETYKHIICVQPDAVVVMMTAFAVEDLVEGALEAGAYGIVYKPFDFEKIISLIEESQRIDKGVLVLVIDDEPGFCTTMRNILAKRGFNVCIAESGEEAIAMTCQREYDIIFIDMNLPVLNGLETYLAIREINPKAIAILMTAYQQEMSQLVETALKKNAYTCLYKPINLEKLFSLLDEICTEKIKK